MNVLGTTDLQETKDRQHSKHVTECAAQQQMISMELVVKTLSQD